METVVTLDQLPSFYRNRKVLLTGHTGFKGSWLALWLHSLGAVVRGIALEPAEDAPLYNQFDGDALVESRIGDIRNFEWLRQEVVDFNPEFIFHLAAQPLVIHGYANPLYTYETNVMGTVNLLEAIRSLPGTCQVVMVTTDKVYENDETGHAYCEDEKLGGYDPYSASKACCEIVISSYRNSFFHPHAWATHKKSIASARAGNVIGGGDRSKDRIVPDIIRALEKGCPLVVRNPGSIRPWQHVLEPLAGYLQLGVSMQNNPVKYAGAYNFGPDIDDVLPVRDLVRKAYGYWGASELVEIPEAASGMHEAGLLRLNSGKAHTDLGWKPKYRSDEAIRHTIDWYRFSGDSPAEYSLNQIKSYLNQS